MDIKEFVQTFAQQFEDTDPAEITADTEFRELDEWSSLTGMCIMAMAKTQYGKIITGKELKECETVKDVFDLISSK
ncbi:MAG: acyl carrier protein [Bacteroidales bacterium]|nr:acyl carrier protein [Bacteroidales bacterium]